MKKRTFAGITSFLSFACVAAVYAEYARPAAAQTPPAAATANAESLANGAALYKRHCVMCHGASGRGDGPAAKFMKGNLPNLSDKAFMSKLTDAQIHEQITKGKKSEIGNMPALGKRLKPEEITDIVNYVRTYFASAGD
jgi:mono/diheme cytochrome c family protein